MSLPFDSEIESSRLRWWVAGLVLGFTALRLVLAGYFELVEDEAYYWLWAREPALGYFDHPPMVAWWIALGRAVFGDTEFGVRVIGVLAFLPMTYLIYRTHHLLFDNERRALLSALWLHVTLFTAVGGVVISPDTPLGLFACVCYFALAKVWRTGDGRWWYVVGAAAGAALLSKYTGFFIGLGILIWLLAVPSLRHWFKRFELYVGGLLAAAVFAPNVIWNANNDWVSFSKQFGRLGEQGFDPRFIADFLGGQLGLLTPVIFTFAAIAIGLATLRAIRSRSPEWTFIAAMTVPLLLVLLEYALSDRVQANWTSMIVPLAVIAAVEIAHEPIREGWLHWMQDVNRRWAVTFGLIITGFVYVQAVFDVVPDRGTNDPTSRMKGWSDLAVEVDKAAGTADAKFIATTNYGLTGLLAFYASSDRPVFQVTARARYHGLNAEPPGDVYRQTGVYIARVKKDRSYIVSRAFEGVELLGSLLRRRPGGVVEELVVYVIKDPKYTPPFVDWDA